MIQDQAPSPEHNSGSEAIAPAPTPTAPPRGRVSTRPTTPPRPPRPPRKNTPAPDPAEQGDGKARLTAVRCMGAFLIILAVGGVVISFAYPDRAPQYWTTISPVLGICAPAMLAFWSLRKR